MSETFTIGCDVWHRRRSGPGVLEAQDDDWSIVRWPRWSGKPDMVHPSELLDADPTDYAHIRAIDAWFQEQLDARMFDQLCGFR